MGIEFKLPEISEGVETVDIAEVLVSVGDTISAGQGVVEVETDKAAMEVPCPHAGKVSEVRVSQGDSVSIGAILLVVEASDAATSATNNSDSDSSADAPASPAPTSAPVAEAAPVEAKPQPSTPAALPAVASPASTVLARGNGEGQAPPPASPITRRLARELSVDLHQVNGSGPGGRITRDDVKSFVRTLTTTGRKPQTGISVPMGGGELAELPNFEKFGPISRQPLNKIARMSAAHLSMSWRLIPHVTQHDDADITEMEAARKAFMAGPGKNGPKITMTAIVIKASVAALKAFPNFNSSLDGSANELILKDFYHIGVAVDTPAGLVVPVIRDCDQKSILEIAAELTEIAGRARDRKLSLDDMQGGTFTITNLGGIGGTKFTPIVNHPEVAILGLSRGQKQLEMRDGAVVERLKLPMSLSYDHRVVNGADAARFMVKVSQTLSNFMSLLIEC